MKITKVQSQENRAHIVEIASVLFRERGYDGVSVADLMSAAGFTHGGFYKHFGSKADLMAETAALSISKTIHQANGLDITEFINLYLSRTHRDGRSEGCTMAALCTDAARQSPEIKVTFAEGIENMLAQGIQDSAISNTQDPAKARSRVIGLFAQLLGAVVLSRSCPDDSPLADEILETCRQQILASLQLNTGDEYHN